jgi:hypothetical protein
LSWKQVDEISQRFAALNPYRRDAVPGSILKIEDDNYDPKTKKQRQLWCVAISAKRYALFLRNRGGVPVLLRSGQNNLEDRWSEHGLGHLLNPTDPEDEDREWIAKVWLNIVYGVERISVTKLGFEESPTIGRITISSPTVMKPMTALNTGKPYWDKIKPFNFLLASHVRAFGHPSGIDPERFHLIAPYETDPKKWLQTKWVDQYTGKQYRITTSDFYRQRDTARVKTHGDALLEYKFHPESKCADSQGKPCSRHTIGLLQRRHIRIDSITPIGKESNSLEGVEAGVIHSEQEVYTVYTDPEHDVWEMKMRPALKQIPLPVLEKKSGLSRRTLVYARTGRRRPHPNNRKLLAGILRKLGLV